MSNPFVLKSLSALIIKAAAAGLSFVMFLALAQNLSQQAFGQFGFAFSLATFLSVLGSMGQRNLSLRFVSTYLETGNRAAIRGVVDWGYRRVFLGSGFLAVCLLLAGSFPRTSDHRSLLIATAALTIALALAEFQPNPLRAAGHVWRALFPRDILLRVMMIAYAMLAPAAFGAVQAVWGMCAILFCLVFMQSMTSPITHPAQVLRNAADRSDSPAWRRAQWGFWGNAVLTASGRNVAFVLLGFVLPAAALGAVFAAVRTAMVLELFLMAINIVAAPLLARRLSRDALDDAQALCRKISVMIGIPTLAVFLLFVFMGDHFLALFGPGYGSAYAVLVIVSFGYLVSALAGPTAQLMEMGGHERAYFRMLFTTTLTSLVAIPLAAHAFGDIGAAICISGNLIALNVWAYVFIHRQMGISAGILSLRKRAPIPEVPA